MGLNRCLLSRQPITFVPYGGHQNCDSGAIFGSFDALAIERLNLRQRNRSSWCIPPESPVETR
jgi:hypothetical protein